MPSGMVPKYGVREITTFGFLWLVSTLFHGHTFGRALRFRSFLPWLCIRRILVRCVYLYRPGKPDQYALDGLEAHLSSGPIPAEKEESVEGDGMKSVEPILQVCFEENGTSHATKLSDSKREFLGEDFPPCHHGSREKAVLPVEMNCGCEKDSARPLLGSSVIDALQMMAAVLSGGWV